MQHMLSRVFLVFLVLIFSLSQVKSECELVNLSFNGNPILEVNSCIQEEVDGCFTRISQAEEDGYWNYSYLSERIDVTESLFQQTTDDLAATDVTLNSRIDDLTNVVDDNLNTLVTITDNQELLINDLTESYDSIDAELDNTIYPALSDLADGLEVVNSTLLDLEDTVTTVISSLEALTLATQTNISGLNEDLLEKASTESLNSVIATTALKSFRTTFTKYGSFVYGTSGVLGLTYFHKMATINVPESYFPGYISTGCSGHWLVYNPTTATSAVPRIHSRMAYIVEGSASNGRYVPDLGGGIFRQNTTAGLTYDGADVPPGSFYYKDGVTQIKFPSATGWLYVPAAYRAPHYAMVDAEDNGPSNLLTAANPALKDTYITVEINMMITPLDNLSTYQPTFEVACDFSVHPL